MVVAVGLAARLEGLGAKPLWLDEVTTLHRASLPLGAMVLDSLSFHHLPPYFVISSWFLGLGHDEVALRLPAVLFGAFSCGLACLLAAWLAGAGAGFVAGMLMAAAPIEVQYGQEARSYTLVLCLVLVALWGMLAVLRDADDPSEAARRVRARAMLAYGVGTLGAVLVLGVGIAWFALANLGFLAAVAGDRRLVALRRPWLAVQAAILLLAAPAYLAMAILVERAHGTFESGLDWIPRLSWHHVATAMQSLYMLRISSLIADRMFPARIPLIGLLPLCLCVAGLVALRRDTRLRSVLVVVSLACPLGMIALSAATPMLMPRYLLWSTGPFFVLAGTGVALFGRRAGALACAAIAAASLVNLAPYYRAETKPRWELAAQAVLSSVAPTDTLLIDDPGAVDMMNVFLEREHREIPASSWTMDVSDAACALRTGHRVWALQGRVGQADFENLAQFERRLAPLGAPDLVRRIGLDITLIRFDGPAGDCGAQG